MVKVSDLFEKNTGLLGRNKSAGSFKGGCIKLFHKLTSGSGSFSQ